MEEKQKELLNKKRRKKNHKPTTNLLSVFLLSLGFGVFFVIENSLNFNVFLTFLGLNVLFVNKNVLLHQSDKLLAMLLNFTNFSRFL